jgi:hypothetical protein
MWVAALLYTSILPLAPIGTTAMLEVIALASPLTIDIAAGRATPSGYAAR